MVKSKFHILFSSSAWFVHFLRMPIVILATPFLEGSSLPLIETSYYLPKHNILPEPTLAQGGGQWRTVQL